jgi:hypothetical protein
VGLPLFAASGDEVIRALKRAGYHIVSRGPDHAILEQGYRCFTVRRGELLEPDELLAILRASGVSYPELIELLDAPRYESSVRRRTLPEHGPVAPLKLPKKVAK